MTLFIMASLFAAGEVYEPDNAVGLIGLLIIGLPALFAAILSGVSLIMNSRRNSHTKAKAEVRDQKTQDIASKVEEIKHNVVNNHPRPLREDLDEYFTALNKRLDKHDETLGTLAINSAVNRSEIKSIGERVESIEQHLRRK